MKNLLLFFVTVLLVSCAHENGYTLKGEYPAAKDGTVVYLSEYMVFDLDDMLVPVDSAVVEGGKFSFKGVADGFDVCFLSSSKVVDGGFVVLEKGDVAFTFDGAKCGGTLWNKEVSRFMHEREKVLNIKKLASPAMQKRMLLDPEMFDSINELAVYASRIFDSYAVGLIRKNVNNKLGHFFLTQSAGAVSPGRLLPLFPLIPNEFRDKLYDGKKMQVEAEMEEGLDVAKYAMGAQEVAKETAVGKCYRNFELDDIAGGKVLFSDKVAAGRYTILLFWAAWDSRSVEFLKELAATCSGYSGKGLNVVTVSLDDNVGDCAAVVNSSGIAGAHLCNPLKGSAELASAYGVCELPLCLVINNKGVIISRTSSVDDVKSKLAEIMP